MKKNKLFLIILLLVLGIYFYSDNVSATSTLNCSNTLRYGNSGTQVKILQTELNEVMGCKLAVDGSFGNATKTCVLSFQKANSLVQDAIVGTKSCNKLNELYLEKINANAQDDILKVGSSGTEVRNLQNKLNIIMGCNLSVDGSFGNATKTCVVNFQGKVGLTKDGVVGTKTKNKIEEVYNNRTSTAFSKQGNETTLNCHNSLKKGSYGTNVRLLQTELNKVTDCNLAVDGSFGNGTYNCVKKFQSSQNLDVDGSVGALTCGRLNSEYLNNNNYIISKSVSQIRDGTSSTSFVIAYATYGMVFKNYGTVGSYYKIKYNDSYAYIKTSDVSKNGIWLDISEQNLKLYQNGKIKMDSLIITGLKGVYDTPQGVFTLNVSNKAKTTDTFQIKLMNDSPVDYWMPFYGGYGFHDADAWRSDNEFYNKTRYVYGGSHGCVNMLDADAKMLYNKVTSNINVYIVE